MKKVIRFLIAFATVATFTYAASTWTDEVETSHLETSVAATPSKLPTYSYAGRDSIEAAISAYVVQKFGPQYRPADVTIPIVNILTMTPSKYGETLVWGSFWVLNYEQRGDTLYCVSGGEHPGLAHLKKTSNGGYRVTELEVLEDGSKYIKSAKRIFGQHYNEYFSYMDNNESLRENKRAEMIGDYVKANRLSITKYQDYDWEPKSI